MNKYKVRTDLAMENGEKYEKDNIEIPGESASITTKSKMSVQLW